MPSTKQMESRMLDLPEPLSPVMALKEGSKPETTVRVAYDLKPSITTSSMYMAAAALGQRGGMPVHVLLPACLLACLLWSHDEVGLGSLARLPACLAVVAKRPPLPFVPKPTSRLLS